MEYRYFIVFLNYTLLLSSVIMAPRPDGAGDVVSGCLCLPPLVPLEWDQEVIMEVREGVPGFVSVDVLCGL